MVYRNKTKKITTKKQKIIACSADAESWIENLKAELKRETEEVAALDKLVRDFRMFLHEKNAKVMPYIRNGRPYFGPKIFGLFHTKTTKLKSEEYERFLNSYVCKCRERIGRFKIEYPNSSSNFNHTIREFNKTVDHDHVEFCYTYRAKRKNELREKIEIAHKVLKKEREKEACADRKKAKQNQQKAVVASAMGKTRDLAAYLKSKLSTEHPCPYCGGELGACYHADHIYPVSKGGQSREENMVNVCASCNLKKRDQTLIMFIKKYDLDRRLIESRLSYLGKEY
jgi:5-methylcytosine-specific restriction endonuclease McrA